MDLINIKIYYFINIVLWFWCVSPQISYFNFIPIVFGIMRRSFCESGSIKRDGHHERISAFVTEASRESSPSLLFTFHHVRMQQTAALTRNQHQHHDLGLSWARKVFYHLSHSAKFSVK
jgi:hypothetical protein